MTAQTQRCALYAFTICTVQAHITFLHFVTQQIDFIPSFAASRVAVDSADLQFSCVWSPYRKGKKMCHANTKQMLNVEKCCNFLCQ